MSKAETPARPTASEMRGVIPYIGFDGRANEAADFYATAFGATDLGRMPNPDDPTRLMHAQVGINGGALMMTDHGGEDGAESKPLNRAHMQLVVDDGRMWWDRAVAAGCTALVPYERQFWGDDWGMLEDPFGVRWAVLQPGDMQSAASEPLVEVAHHLTLRRVIDAPRAAVWRCWSETDLLKQWFCPKPWFVAEADFDLRPGGRMNTVMAGPEGERIDSKGIWLEVEPMRRLVFTDFFTEGFVPAPEPFMTAVVLLEDAPDGGTQLVWSARHANAETLESHRDMGWEPGWNAAVDQLEEVAKSLASDPG
ncbi:SRPBCC domain-containing protein [Aquicoccus porphyridii]|nr:SRPBCC domain-containing protein [Aquicoccus porphyridii]